MKLPLIYPILDTELLQRRGVSAEVAASAFLDGGARILQFRHKAHWTTETFDLARSVARLCRQAGAQLIINDRVDFALLLHAGLHLGQDDLPPRDARKLLGADAIIGFSTHNAGQFRSAGEEPVGYVALGPMFPTSSKRNPDPVVGLEELRLCRSLLDKPIVAIGGITLENAADVLRAGADSLAIVSGMLPESAAPRSFRERMEEWRKIARTI
jgi:thiamine-phosphate pyrophosphorylase